MKGLLVKWLKKAELIIKEIICQVKANENLAEISYLLEDIKRLEMEKKKQFLSD